MCRGGRCCARNTTDLLRRTREHDAVAFCRHFRAVVARSAKQGWNDKFVRLDDHIQTLLSSKKSFQKPATLSETNPLFLPSTVSTACQKFFEDVQRDVGMVNRFYAETETSFYERWSQLESYARESGHQAQVLKAGMTSLYRGLLLLQNYADENFTALSEIVRLYEKVVDQTDSSTLRDYIMQKADFNKQAIQLPGEINKLERSFAAIFCDGDEVWAKQTLNQGTAPPTEKFRDIFSLGFFNGLALPLFILCIDTFAVPATYDSDPHLIYASIPIYRGTGLIILALWLWGACIYVFTRFGINYAFILDLKPPSILSHFQIFKTTAFLSFLWFCSLFFYAAMVRRGLQILPPEVPTLYYHVALVAILLAFTLCPFRIFHRTARFWMLRRLASVVAAPFAPVTFADIIIGDYLTSLVKPLYDLEFVACLYGTGDFINDQLTRCQLNNRAYALPIVTALPLFWRLMQCLRRFYDTRMKHPHLVNAGKYGTGVIAVAIGAIHADWNSKRLDWPVGRVFWLAILILSTIYSYTWDITMDWSFFVIRNGRPTLRQWQFGPQWVMVVVMVLNLIGRCAWMFTLVVAPMTSEYSNEFLVFLFAFIEVLRRTQWAIVRLENEYTANYAKFRLMDDVYVPTDLAQPLTFDRSLSQTSRRTFTQ